VIARATGLASTGYSADFLVFENPHTLAADARKGQYRGWKRVIDIRSRHVRARSPATDLRGRRCRNRMAAPASASLHKPMRAVVNHCASAQCSVALRMPARAQVSKERRAWQATPYASQPRQRRTGSSSHSARNLSRSEETKPRAQHRRPRQCRCRLAEATGPTATRAACTGPNRPWISPSEWAPPEFRRAN